MMHDRLKGKTCIVTGSGGSIGRVACLRFAAEGMEPAIRLIDQAANAMGARP